TLFPYTTLFRSNVIQAQPARKLPTASQLGIGITSDDPTGPPRLGFDTGLTIGFSPQGPTHLIDNTFVWADTLTKVTGNHTLKFGGSYSPYENNTVYDFYVNGEFDFYAGTSATGSGNPYADFLMGVPSEFIQFPKAPSNIRSKHYDGFAQDEWKVLHNLTMTLGVRYEYSSPKLDTMGRSF